METENHSSLEQKKKITMSEGISHTKSMEVSTSLSGEIKHAFLAGTTLSVDWKVSMKKHLILVIFILLYCIILFCNQSGVA